MTVNPPAPRPCASCPYRCDVPSGVWADEEYAKLPGYDDDAPTPAFGVFLCHQNDKGDDRARMCAGWVATHGGENLLALRIALMQGTISTDTYSAACEYTTDVPVFESGADAAEHGTADIDNPSDAAVAAIGKIRRRRTDLKDG